MPSLLSKEKAREERGSCKMIEQATSILGHLEQKGTSLGIILLTNFLKVCSSVSGAHESFGSQVEP
jgi:hypothetical protein